MTSNISSDIASDHLYNTVWTTQSGNRAAMHIVETHYMKAQPSIYCFHWGHLHPYRHCTLDQPAKKLPWSDRPFVPNIPPQPEQTKHLVFPTVRGKKYRGRDVVSLVDHQRVRFHRCSRVVQSVRVLRWFTLKLARVVQRSSSTVTEKPRIRSEIHKYKCSSKTLHLPYQTSISVYYTKWIEKNLHDCHLQSTESAIFLFG